MSTVSNIPVTLMINPYGYTYIYIQFPQEMGSKFAIFAQDEDLSNVTINNLLFQLNAVFMEETTRFSIINMIGTNMLTFFGSKGVNVNSKIYNEDGTFIDSVREFLLDCIPNEMDMIYRMRLN